MSEARYGAAVVGGGPAGLAAALCLGRLGLVTALVGPAHRPAGGDNDQRTAALFTGSVELLRNLGAWSDIRPESEPIEAIRIIDDTGALLRAPEVVFTAAEVGLDVFGANIPNRALVAGLRKAALSPGSNVVFVETDGVSRVEGGEASAILHLKEGGRIAAGLVAGADGRRSVCREGAQIGVRTWDYPQSALVCSFAHERPHKRISTEFHRPAGPCTTVPLPGNASSLVWVETRDEALRLAGLDEEAFRKELEARLQGLLGSVGTIGPRAVFPLSGLAAEAFARNRVALVGEAGHVVPPIGAQGLNLGLRDGAALADCVADALREGRDPGGAETLEAYGRARHSDVSSRIFGIDILNRSLISGWLPVHLARGLGLHALRAIGPLRRVLVREGLDHALAKPSLMQPGGSALLAERRRRAEDAAGAAPKQRAASNEAQRIADGVP
jgi:2-octaprenyl-6-methoxyphenol hydroxylase